MSSIFKNLENVNLGGEDLQVNLMNWSVVQKGAPIAIYFQIGDLTAAISLDDFRDMCFHYLVRGGLFGWENMGGIPASVQKFIEAVKIYPKDLPPEDPPSEDSPSEDPS